MIQLEIQKKRRKEKYFKNGIGMTDYDFDGVLLNFKNNRRKEI